MSDIRETWRVAVASALESLRQEKDLPGDPVDAGTLSAEVPPNPAMGDVGFPLFPFAKVFRMAPPALAAEVSARLAADDALAQFGTVKAVGPYVNVFLAKAPSEKPLPTSSVRVTGGEKRCPCRPSRHGRVFEPQHEQTPASGTSPQRCAWRKHFPHPGLLRCGGFQGQYCQQPRHPYLQIHARVSVFAGETRNRAESSPTALWATVM